MKAGLPRGAANLATVAMLAALVGCSAVAYFYANANHSALLRGEPISSLVFFGLVAVASFAPSVWIEYVLRRSHYGRWRRLLGWSMVCSVLLVGMVVRWWMVIPYWEIVIVVCVVGGLVLAVSAE